jgi:hypothetical protein
MFKWIINPYNAIQTIFVYNVHLSYKNYFITLIPYTKTSTKFQFLRFQSPFVTFQTSSWFWVLEWWLDADKHHQLSAWLYLCHWHNERPLLTIARAILTAQSLQVKHLWVCCVRFILLRLRQRYHIYLTGHLVSDGCVLFNNALWSRVVTRNEVNALHPGKYCIF